MSERSQSIKINLINEQVHGASGDQQEKTADHTTGCAIAVIGRTAVHIALDTRLPADWDVGCLAGCRAAFYISIFN